MVVSTTATSPFFLTTGIIGIVSFVFTLGTFVRVIWVNLETLNEAPHEGTNAPILDSHMLIPTSTLISYQPTNGIIRRESQSEAHAERHEKAQTDDVGRKWT